MALAPFFDKAALAAAAVLQGFDRAQFAAHLERHEVGLAFDTTAVARAEGRTTLTLLANLLARLYPTVALVPLGTEAAAFAPDLDAVLHAVNPLIDVHTAPAPVTGTRAVPDAGPGFGPAVVLVVGDTAAAAFNLAPALAIYVGSAAWEARVSTDGPVGVGTSALPFGAAAAACLGAANVFRHVFAAQLPGAALDSVLTFSTLSLTTRATLGALGIPALDAGAPTALPDMALGEVVQVGAGAVGEGLLWTLARTPGVTGMLHVVDDQTVDASNPQRYVLAASNEAGVSKVALAAELFGGPPASPAGSSVLRAVAPAERSRLTVVPHTMRWGAFLSHRPSPWRLARVLVALDSAKDRIAVQAALPAWIANAWTQPGDLGVSRHAGLGRTACLGCLYIPQVASTRHEDVTVAEAIGVPDQLLAVRQLLATNAPVNEALLRLVAERLRIPFEDILPFAGRPLRAFYSEAVCGGLVMRLRARVARVSKGGAGAAGGDPAGSHGPGEPDAADAAGQPRDRAAMVPMAFQSVLAGVLLSAALVADTAGLPAPRPGQKAVLNLLRPVPVRLLVPVAPHPSGKCLCQDPDYRHAFMLQWAALEEGAAVDAGHANGHRENGHREHGRCHARRDAPEHALRVSAPERDGQREPDVSMHVDDPSAAPV